MNNYKILFLLSFLEYIFDIFTKMECNTFIGHLFLYFHHIVAIYIYFGGVLFNTKYHLIFMLFLIYHWLFNDLKCKLTEYTNYYCGKDITIYHEFNDNLANKMLKA